MLTQIRFFFIVLGDLSFFYDLNSIGNRHLPKNLRILLVNNGRGVEFRNPYHPCFQFGEDADPFMAAAGHFGNMSSSLISHYAKDLGFEYQTASDKETYLEQSRIFLDSQLREKPILFEVFVKTQNEQNAIIAMHNLISDPKGFVKNAIRSIVPYSTWEKLHDMKKK